jgi:DNA anti-recombination protein RmuC
LRATNAELVQETQKLQKMLRVQEDINRDYKELVEEGKAEAKRLTFEFEQKLEDESRLLDIKSDRIRKLEAQLNNFIYKRSRGAIYPDETIFSKTRRRAGN